MIRVAQVLPDARNIFGFTEADRLYEKVLDAVTLLADKGDWSPLMAYLDICCSGREVTLPSTVEVPHAFWMDGQPTLPHDELFAFHLNGPGNDWSPTTFSWMDRGDHATYRDLPRPAGIYAASDSPTDRGKTVIVRGFAADGSELQHQGNPGLPIPIFGPGTVVTSVPVVRITRVDKPVTAGRVRLYSADFNGGLCQGDGTLLADWEYWETLPRYRRVLLSRPAKWVRAYVRLRKPEVLRSSDVIPLSSKIALAAAMRAIRDYDGNDLERGMANESIALRMLSDRESTLRPPTSVGPQIHVAGEVIDDADQVH